MNTFFKKTAAHEDIFYTPNNSASEPEHLPPSIAQPTHQRPKKRREAGIMSGTRARLEAAQKTKLQLSDQDNQIETLRSECNGYKEQVDHLSLLLQESIHNLEAAREEITSLKNQVTSNPHPSTPLSLITPSDQPLIFYNPTAQNSTPIPHTAMTVDSPTPSPVPHSSSNPYSDEDSNTPKLVRKTIPLPDSDDDTMESDIRQELENIDDSSDTDGRGNIGQSSIRFSQIHKASEPWSEDDDVQLPRRVPSPTRYSRPKGGAGPTLRFKESSSTSTPRAAAPTPISSGTNGISDEMLARVIFFAADYLEKKKKQDRKPRIVLKSSQVKNPIEREPSDPRRKVLCSLIREHLNLLLDIKRTKDVRKLAQPNPTDVQMFAKGKGPGPKLGTKPFPICFAAKKDHIWNDDLRNQFISAFKAKVEIDEAEGEELLVLELYDQRIRNLRTEFRGVLPRSDEDEVGTSARVKVKDERKRLKNRKSTRRNTLLEFRQQLAMSNQAEYTGETKKVWDFLLRLVNMLGQQGMSSDESESDDGMERRQKCLINVLPWRHRDLTPYLKRIDKDVNLQNQYGHRRAGTQPRVRLRHSPQKQAALSKREAVPGLPFNFYDSTWYATLSPRDKTLLRTKPPMDLPMIVD